MTSAPFCIYISVAIQDSADTGKVLKYVIRNYTKMHANILAFKAIKIISKSIGGSFIS